MNAIIMGILNAVLVAVILVLVGALIVWVFSKLGFDIPWNIQQLFLAVVALVFLIIVVGLLLGLPQASFRIIGQREPLPALPVGVPPPSVQVMR